MKLTRILCCGLAALCTLTTAFAQEDLEQRLDAVKEFKRYFRRFKDVPQKVEAVRTLEAAECVQAAEVLLGLFDHKIPEVGRVARDVLGGYREAKTFEAMIAELSDLKNQERRAALIDVLGRAGITAAAPVVASIVLEDSRADDGVRFASAQAFARIGGRAEGGDGGIDARVVEALAALLADTSPLVRMAACDSVGVLDVDALGPRVVELLGDSDWKVELAAIGAASKLRTADAVNPLIAILRDGGRAVEESADALFHITGMDLGPDAESWQSMWDRLSKIEGWRIPTDEELAKKAESRKRYDALYGKVDNANSFGGIKTTSTRILFIVDISGSMDDLVVQREKFDAGYPDYKKLTIMKTELIRTIDELDAHTMFNIAAFATKVRPWKKFLVPANGVNRASAKDFVDRLKALGGKESQGLAGAGLGGSANLAAGKTNTFAALMYAFGIDPAKDTGGPVTDSEAVKSALDTVFFLSDGRPSTGKLVDERQILRRINEINELFRVTFHVIAIGEFQKQFLSSLASDNGGVFVDLGH